MKIDADAKPVVTAGRVAPAAMLDGPIVRPMLALAAPMVVVLVAQTIVGVAETFYVGRLGTDALAGAALVFPLVMLMTMMSNGGIGGGVSSAVARAIGAGRQDDADDLVLHAVVLAILFGLVFTAGAILLGPPLYAALGGRAGVLDVAITYSTYIFAAAVPTWITNLMAAALRGVGNVRVPALVTMLGCVVLVPLSPLLIFGFGPIPRFGVAGAGIAIMIYYLGATAYLGAYLVSGRGGLTLRPGRLRWPLFASILKVGLISAVGTLVTNLTVIVVTGLIGPFGAAAIAGYGAASRLDYVLIPFLFGLGTAVITMVGVNSGAGRHARARRIAWTGAAIAAVTCEIIGCLAALVPHVWVGIFSKDPAVLAAGATYLHRVGPAYGAVGLGMLLYFAAQGTGRMLVPFVAGLARLGVAAGLGGIAVHRLGADLPMLYLIVAAGSLIFGAVNAGGMLLRRAPAPPKILEGAPVARYEKGRKGETRGRIVELAARRFRADGVDGVGIATLMAEAGLTNGGFYAHFRSKEELVKEAVVHALAGMPEALGETPFDLPAFVARYLSTGHRDHPESGCAIAALAPDLARRPAVSRAAFAAEGHGTIARIAAALPEPVDANERRARAIAVFAHLLGTLQMARFVIDAEVSDAILARGRAEAMRLAGFETARD